MLTQEQAVEIRVLAKRGLGLREIARLTGNSRNTVRRYLRSQEVTRYKARAARTTKLEPYKAYLAQRIEAAHPQWIPAVVLMREIAERGYEGGISQLRAWVAAMKPSVRPDPVRRFETEPGEQMQADFTVVRRGRASMVALVATLGYSRASYVRFTEREDAAALSGALRAAFEYFGGVPQHVLFDNAKTVVLTRDAYGPGRHRWNPQLMDLATQYGFSPRLCRPYRAKTKGKVERFNRYLKGSFLVPLATRLAADGLRLDVDTANRAVLQWLEEVANARVHATTGAVPAERLELERHALLPVPRAVNRPPGSVSLRRPPPYESLQHPLAIYDQLLELVA